MPIFAEHLENGNTLGFGTSDFPLLWFPAEFQGDEHFDDHRHGEKQIQNTHNRYYRIGIDKQAGKRCKEDGHQTADAHPGVDIDKVF